MLIIILKLFILYFSTFKVDATQDNIKSREKRDASSPNLYTQETLHYMRSYGILNCQFAYCPDNYKKKDAIKTPTSAAGIIINECEGKQFLLTNNLVRFADTWNECCKYGMIPASIESHSEMSCVQENFQEQDGSDDKPFFTAIIDVYPWNIFQSCVSENNITNKELWKSKALKLNGNIEACVALSLEAEQFGYVNVPCTAQHTKPVICELSTNRRVMKAYHSKNFVRDFRDPVNHYAEHVYGFMAHNKIYPQCKSAFCDNEVRFTDVWNECCKYGMMPAKIDTFEDLECLGFLYLQRYKDNDVRIMMNHMDGTFDRTFVSCTSGKIITPDMWMDKEPDNAGWGEACASVTVNTDSPDRVAFSDLNCGNINHPLLCEDTRNKTEVSFPMSSQIKIALRTKRYNKEAIFLNRRIGLTGCINAICKINEDDNPKKFNSLSGILVTKCSGKTFLFRNKKMKPAEVWKDCCAYAMIPATIESKEEMDCLKESYVEQNGPMEIQSASYFTAYFDAYLNGNFISCATGKSLQKEMWIAKKPEALTGQEACATFQVGSGFSDVPCTVEFSVICEMPKKPFSIANYTIDKSVITQKASAYYAEDAISNFITKFVPDCKTTACENNAKRSDLESLPNKILTGCRKNFMITKNLVSSSEVWSECCKYEMIPATIDNQFDAECFNIEILEKERISKLIFHVGHIDSNLNRTFVSCVTGAAVTKEMWFPGEPNNSEKSEICAVFNKNGAVFKMHDGSCENRFAVLCESPFNNAQWLDKYKIIKQDRSEWRETISPEAHFETTPITTSTTPIPVFLSRNYNAATNLLFDKSRIFKCESLYCKEPPQAKNNVVKIGKAPKDAGKLINDCGKQLYLFSQKKVSYPDIWKECCNLGMIPASIESKDQIKCLHQKHFLKLDKKVTIFYTGQMDAYLERRFVSCASGNLVPAEVWSKDEPDNKDNREACVALRFDNFTAGLSDIKCDDNINVICESTEKLERFSMSKILVTTPTPVKQNIIKPQSSALATNVVKNTKKVLPPNIKPPVVLPKVLPKVGK